MITPKALLLSGGGFALTRRGAILVSLYYDIDERAAFIEYFC